MAAWALVGVLGLAALGALFALVVWLVRRNEKRAENAAHSTTHATVQAATVAALRRRLARVAKPLLSLEEIAARWKRQKPDSDT